MAILPISPPHVCGRSSHRIIARSIRAAESMAPAPFRGVKSGAVLGPGLRPFVLSEPARDTRNGFAHFVGRTSIAKANEPTAVNRIEIDAGGGRDARLLQHLFGKLETVGGEFGDIGGEVERAVGRQEFVEAGLRQPLYQ